MIATSTWPLGLLAALCLSLDGEFMYLHDVRMRNYSIHKDTRIHFSPITVLVGPNGTGKSALFDGLLNFSMLSRGNIGQAFGQYPYSYAATKHRGANKVDRIGFEVLMSPAQDSPEKLRYTINYSQKSEGASPVFEIHKEKLELGDVVLFDRDESDATSLKAALPFVTADTGILAAIRRSQPTAPNDAYPPIVVECSKQISRFNKFRLEPHILGLPSSLPDLSLKEPPRIEYEGGNLAATLYFMKETKLPVLDTIREGVRKALPAFDDFDFNTVGNQRIGFSMHFTDSRQTIPAARLSDGQLLVVGLMTLVCAPSRPPVLMLEEPENGLTATVQRVLYSAVRELAFRANPLDRSQVLISSHSPFVLCEAWNGLDRNFIHQVKVEDGRALVRPFADVITAQQIQLGKDDKGERTILSLKNAEEIMAGYMS